jgi:sterol desaturase/sphingolipid hydroxylase (fatty acid hydroxylase superfamily)
MLTQEEQKFVEYWKNNREREKKLFRQLLIGLPAGLLFAVAILSIFSTGWYKRAHMEAYSGSSPIIFLVAIFAIIGFIAIFSKRHKWDMNEQHYLELLEKQKKVDAAGETNK